MQSNDVFVIAYQEHWYEHQTAPILRGFRPI